MKKNSFAILMMIILIVGCISPATSTPVPVESQTMLPPPTLTALPTATQPAATQPMTTPAIISTLEAPLKTGGPYLAYFRDASYQFVLMDADGGGRKVIDIPDEIADISYRQLDPRYVSPDGRWLAFYSGSAGDYRELMAPGTFKLTLNLLDLNTGEIQAITPLLSKDYPDNFTKAIDHIDDSLARPEDLQNAFLGGITQALAWSPDGKYLAFAGQMDGLSSDPYLYDTMTKKIQRLSSNKEELQWIAWSSDGKWILHGSKLSIEPMVEYNIYSVGKDDLSIRDLGSGFAGRWLSSHEFLQYHMGIETYQLRSVDVATGKFKEIWEGYFYGYSVDPTGKWIALTAISSTVPPKDEEPGFVYGATQLINLKSLEKMQIQDQGPDPSSFLSRLFVRAKDGTVIDLSHTIETTVASPDQKYWAVFGAQGITIYTRDLILIKEIPVSLRNTKSINAQWSPDDMQWSPDSSGLFLVYGANVYYTDISSGDINLVEENLSSSIKWVNDQ